MENKVKTSRTIYSGHSVHASIHRFVHGIVSDTVHATIDVFHPLRIVSTPGLDSCCLSTTWLPDLEIRPIV